jgi:hypothetical protein
MTVTLPWQPAPVAPECNRFDFRMPSAVALMTDGAADVWNVVAMPGSRPAGQRRPTASRCECLNNRRRFWTLAPARLEFLSSCDYWTT